MVYRGQFGETQFVLQVVDGGRVARIVGRPVRVAPFREPSLPFGWPLVVGLPCG